MTMLRVLAAMCVIGAGCGAMQAQASPAKQQPQNVQKIKTKSNIKNDRTSAPQTGTPAPTPVGAAKIKSHSNQTNNREAQPTQTTGGTPAPKPVDAAKIKSHSNQTNNREAQPGTGTPESSRHK